MRRGSIAALALLAYACTKSPPPIPPASTDAPATESDSPQTRTVEVSDEYFGETVADPYRWLENWDDQEVKAWSETQNGHAREYLDALAVAEQLRPEAEAILSAPVVTYSNVTRAGIYFFASRKQPPKPQPLVVRLESLDDTESAKVVIDPSTLDDEGSTHVDWFRPSPDGSLLAVSLSVGGSESGDVHVFDVESGERVGEVVPRVQGGTAGGDLEWTAEGNGFWYTRYPAEGERPAEDLAFYQQLYFHELDKPVSEDRFELGKDFPRVAEIQVARNPLDNQVLATVQLGDGGQFMHHLRRGRDKWTQLSEFGDGTVHMLFGQGSGLYAVTRADAPRGRLVVTNTKLPNLAKAREVLAQGEDTLVTDFWDPITVVPTRTRLYAQYQTGGPSEIRTFDHKGKPADGPVIPPVSAVAEMIPLKGDDLLYATTSYVEPKRWFVWDAKAKQSRETALSSKSAADFSNVEVRREMAKSKDGTEVPVNIIMPKGAKLDGNNPCLVTGYGGFGIALTPYQRDSYAMLLKRGFIIAVVNLRGGSEFGNEWHEAGRLTKKQNVFDDFAGALQHMIDRGYTKSERLAIEGGSNGGLLMGATLVQHPDLVKAVIAHVGIYDMLRVELSSNGAFNVVEFGTVEDEAQYKAMRAYSPYHNVKDGTAYPAVLFMTGANDPRVDPMQSRKMTARLQAATTGGPILLRTSANTGHGAGTPLAARIEQTVDAYAFLLTQLGVE